VISGGWCLGDGEMLRREDVGSSPRGCLAGLTDAEDEMALLSLL